MHIPAKIGLVSTAKNQIRSFWRWFADHRSEFNVLSNPDEPFWDLALQQIKRIDERLWFELSSTDNGVREFVVTAEGHVEAFPVAEILVNLAPELEGWVFVALKPPMGFEFTTHYEGALFEPRLMWFLPLEDSSRPHDLGMRVGIQGLESMDKSKAHNAVLVILDTALGERSAAVDIQYTEVSELPADPESFGYIELPELPSYISWRKRKLNSRQIGSNGKTRGYFTREPQPAPPAHNGIACQHERRKPHDTQSHFLASQQLSRHRHRYRGVHGNCADHRNPGGKASDGMEQLESLRRKGD